MTGLSDDTAPTIGANGRMTADQRRAVILNAARREFSQVGFHGTSTATIAALAGCSEPMLYKHFPNKHALFVAVLDDVGATMESQLDALLLGPGDPFANWFNSLPATMTNPTYAEMVGLRKLAIAVAATSPDIAQALRDSTDRMVKRTRTAVVRAQTLGTVRADVDADYVVWLWLGITLVGSHYTAINGPDGFASMLPNAQQFLQDIGTAPV